MTDDAVQLLLASSLLVMLTFAVGLRTLAIRVVEMKRRGIDPQDIAGRAEREAVMKDARASDNYNHLFELPVLFYALMAFALALGHTPNWLVLCAWMFVISRVVHSAIQCSTNRVLWRFSVFMLGFAVMLVSWSLFLGQLLL